jgi:uncharacterized protein with gpF-like domain
MANNDNDDEIIAEGGILPPPISVFNDFNKTYSDFSKEMFAISQKAINRILEKSKTIVGTGKSLSVMAGNELDDLLDDLDSLVTNKVPKDMQDLFNKTNETSNQRFSASMGKVSKKFRLGKTFTNRRIKEIMRASIKTNVGLARSLSQTQYKNIEELIFRSILSEQGVNMITSKIVEQIPDIKNKTRKRANFIAQDQTRKAYNNLSIAKMASVGVNEFQWFHSNAGKVPRPFHKTMSPAGLNRGIFSIKNPPIIDEKTGERGFPGQLINCRCFPKPVIVV